MHAVKDQESETLQTLLEWRRAGHSVDLVTVAATWSSAPRPPGSMAVVRDDGAVAGSVSGGCIERELVAARRTNAKVHDATLVVSNHAAQAIGLTCGGELNLIFDSVDNLGTIEAVVHALGNRQRLVRTTNVCNGTASIREATPADRFAWDGTHLQCVHGPAWRVVLIGAGQLSRYVARFAQAVDFDVVVCEPRAAFREGFDIDGAKLIDALPDDAVADYASDSQTAVLALTHEPTLDDLALEEALGADCFHIGALGSLQSHEKRIARLSSLGVLPETMDRISAPVGIDIGSRSAAEIAVSIVAELVAARAAG